MDSLDDYSSSKYYNGGHYLGGEANKHDLQFHDGLHLVAATVNEYI